MNYKQTVRIAQAIIKSITNTGNAVVIALKDFSSKNIFKVNVVNPVSKMEITGKTEITNLKDIESQLKNNALATRELIKPIKSDKKVSVLNLGDIKFPKFPKFDFPKTIRVSNLPKDVKVSNLKDLVPALKMMADSIEKIDVRPEINVKAPVVNVDAPVVKVPKQEPPIINIEAPDLSDLTKIIQFLNKLGARNPLPVRLSDGNKFYKALDRMADIYAGSTFSAYQDSGGHDARAKINRNHEVQVTSVDTWSLNDVHTINNGQLTYLGEETVDGRWRVTRVQKIGIYNVMKYATTRNNSVSDTYTYENAWENHESLDYSRVSEAL